jgi:hypothetical protein
MARGTKVRRADAGAELFASHADTQVIPSPLDQ